MAANINLSTREARRIIRVTVHDQEYAPYYYNCLKCEEPLMHEDERLCGVCEMCQLVDEMERES